jgi:putative protease
MRAAVANGADAVYFGLQGFNARQRAKNFSFDELPEVMRFLHRHNVRGFVTFNILIFSDEMPEAVEFIRRICDAGVDAVIVQDLGLVRLIKRIAPGLEVHGSTQMTLTEPRGIEFVRGLGVERVVVARELSVADIEKITQASSMPLEVFIHGALCVAYSGQCLTSESLGGRSANRGQCAQACRMPYDLIVDGQRRELTDDIKYLVSPTDLAGHDHIGAMARLGVASFKIEGRLKDAHYVAETAQVYRDAIDAASRGEAWSINQDVRRDLNVVYSRTFTPGFLGGVDHQQLVPGHFPKARGLRVGRLINTTDRGFVIQLDPGIPAGTLKPGDGIVFDEGRPEQDEAHGQVYRADLRADGRRQEETTPARVLVELGNRDARPEEVQLGAIVWKNSDPALNKRLEQTYARDRIVHRAPIDLTLRALVGEAPTLSMSDGTHTVDATSSHVIERAQKFAIGEQHARFQLDRLKDTPFVLRDLALITDGISMVPNSVLADLRRDAVEQLVEARHRSTVVRVVEPDGLERLRADLKSASGSRDAGVTPRLHVLARTVEQVQALADLHASNLRASEPSCLHSIYCDFEDVRRYALAMPIARGAGLPIALATMRIIKPGEEGWLMHVLKCEPDAIIVRNLAGIGFYHDVAPLMPLIGDFSLNIANEFTASIFAEAGLVRMVPSYDLSWKQLSAMVRRTGSSQSFEIVVHQHMPMFHMEHCVFARTLSNGKDYRDCGRPCERHKVDLKEAIGKSHPLIPDAGCRNTLFNGEAQSAMDYLPRMLDLGVRDFRIELLRQSPEEVAPLVRKYRQVLDRKAEPKQTMRSLKVLAQLGVTAGTFERE